MREILFRGKRKDNGEWVFGGFTNDAADNPRITTKTSDGFGLVFHEVIPETVGEYTGLLDCKGQKIFEGDILRVDHQGIYIGSVHYKEAQFFGAGDYLQNAVDHGAIVIGNIHDNPELLEVNNEKRN